jgi:hypothetical protein
VGSVNSVRNDDIVDSEVWPDKITLVYQDEIGRQQTFVREKFGESTNVSDPDAGLTFVPIESYGQGDTAETIQHCDKDPSVLLDFLDSFLNLATLRREDELLQEQLLENQTWIERLMLEVKTIPDIEKAKKNADAQVRVLKDQEAHVLVELEQKLANGKNFRVQLIDSLSKIVSGVRDCLSEKCLLEEVLALDCSSLPVGKDQFARVKKALEELDERLERFSEDINKECDSAVRAIKAQLAEWSSSEAETQKQINSIRKDLEAKGIRLNVPFIKKVTKDASDYEVKLRDLQRKAATLRKYQSDRAALVLARRKIKERIFQHRSARAIALEQNLRSTIVEFQISVKYHQGTHSPELEALIKKEMEWRTSQVPRAALIGKSFSPLGLLDAICNKNHDAFLSICDEDGFSSVLAPRRGRDL